MFKYGFSCAVWAYQMRQYSAQMEMKAHPSRLAVLVWRKGCRAYWTRTATPSANRINFMVAQRLERQCDTARDKLALRRKAKMHKRLGL